MGSTTTSTPLVLKDHQRRNKGLNHLSSVTLLAASVAVIGLVFMAYISDITPYLKSAVATARGIKPAITCHGVPRSFRTARHRIRSLNGLRSLSRSSSPSSSLATNAQRVRFAPSPTGSLHVGGARTALYNWLIAQKEGDSKFVLRIEDTDVARSTRESEESVLGDLKWLGLHWDEGPFRQSERGDVYKEMVNKLVESGHAYPCFCTDEELEEAKQRALAEGKNAKYDGKWRDADPELVEKMLREGVPHTYRFKVPKGKVVTIEDKVRGTVSWDAEATLGDFILLRSSGIPVYNFCVAVDDALMGISTVIRAEEHLTNTLRQVLILEALGFATPEYAHLSLILGQDKQKLSKRHGATSVTQFSEEGFLPEAMINYLSLLGWNEGTEQEIYEIPELVEKFTLERVIKSPAVFDMDKLKWINSQHIRKLTPEKLEELISPFFKGANPPLPCDASFLAAATKMCQPRMEVLSDSVDITRAALSHSLVQTLETDEAKKLLEGDETFQEFAAAIVSDFENQKIPAPVDEDFEAKYKKWAKELGKRTGRKGKQLFMPLRLLLTGSMQGPEVPHQLQLAQIAHTEGDVKEAVGLEERINNIKSAFKVNLCRL